jgi:DNA-binding MarR family transcriptional regulator
MARELTSEDYENLLAFRTSLRRFLHWSQTQARGAGMTPAHHQLLLAVKGHRGPKGPAIGDLAGYLLLRHHSTVELVGRAEAAGLVERWSDNDDGRIARVRLTAEGERRLDRLASAHLDELQQLAPVLDQLVARWNSRTTPGSPGDSGSAQQPPPERPSAGAGQA